MSEHSDGGPAFPSYPQEENHDGMTLRDYFAAAALNALIRIAPMAIAGGEAPTPSKIAEEAYLLADAMLEDRGK